MKPLRLLSNGTYHVDADGCGRSRRESVALTRWREDASGNSGGTDLCQLLVESRLGLRRRGDPLRLETSLPRHRPGFKVSCRHGASAYEVRCRHTAAHESGAVRIDGVLSVDGAILLHDDGRTVAVEVVVPQDGGRAAKAGHEGTQCNLE